MKYALYGAPVCRWSRPSSLSTAISLSLSLHLVFIVRIPPCYQSLFLADLAQAYIIEPNETVRESSCLYAGIKLNIICTRIVERSLLLYHVGIISSAPQVSVNGCNALSVLSATGVVFAESNIPPLSPRQLSN